MLLDLQNWQAHSFAAASKFELELELGFSGRWRL